MADDKRSQKVAWRALRALRKVEAPEFTNNRDCRLLNLPIELRQEIWSQCVAQKRTFVVPWARVVYLSEYRLSFYTKNPAWANLAWLRTSKQMYYEGMKAFAEYHEFWVESIDHLTSLNDKVLRESKLFVRYLRFERPRETPDFYRRSNVITQCGGKDFILGPYFDAAYWLKTTPVCHEDQFDSGNALDPLDLLPKLELSTTDASNSFAQLHLKEEEEVAECDHAFLEPSAKEKLQGELGWLVKLLKEYPKLISLTLELRGCHEQAEFFKEIFIFFAQELKSLRYLRIERNWNCCECWRCSDSDDGYSLHYFERERRLEAADKSVEVFVGQVIKARLDGRSKDI